jgi:hypothetical protein
MPRRLAVALLFLFGIPPAKAHADWLITPFLGTSFAGETNFLTFGGGAGRKLTLGASVALLSDGILGLEAEVSHTPGFFKGNDPLGGLVLVLTSRVTMLSGNVIVAAPLALTRESLRPYLVGGFGLMQARSKHLSDVFPVDQNVLGLGIGAGAIGFVTERTGLRVEFRHIKAITGTDGPLARPGSSRLSFWRAMAGLTLRY